MTRFFNLLLAFFLLACGGSTQSEQSDQTTLKEEVMAVHDEVMPKMGELRSMEKKLRAKGDSLLASDSLLAQKHIAAADAIKHANDGMMTWMRSFDPNYEGTEEEIKSYMESQKDSIEKVRDNMLQSLDSGKRLLESY